MSAIYRYATRSLALQTLLLLPLTTTCAWLFLNARGPVPLVWALVGVGCLGYIANILRRALETIVVDERGVAHHSLLGRTDFVAWADAYELRVVSSKSPNPQFRVVSDSGESVKANSLLANYDAALDDVVARVPARALLPLLRAEALDVRILGLDTIVHRAARDPFFCRAAVVELRTAPDESRPLPVSHRDVVTLLRLATPEARKLAARLVERSHAIDREALLARIDRAERQ
jgi:hypothetical protein